MAPKSVCLIATMLVIVVAAPGAGAAVAASGASPPARVGDAGATSGESSPVRVGAVGPESTTAAPGSAGAVGPPAAPGDVAAQAGNCTYPFARTDATGREVAVAEEPETVVTLAPSAAQTMWEIGAREKVVGVSQFATYLENASTRTNVSGAGRTPVNVEAVVGLQPDLVLAPNVIPNSSVAALRRAGLTVYKFRAAESLGDVVEKTRLTGRLVGECEGAAETAAWMDDRIATVREAVAGEPRPRVLYTFFGFTAGNGTFVHEVITTAGGRNVAAEAGITGFAQLNEEVVVRGDPQWIMLNSDAPRVPRSAAFNGTTAVQEDQTVVVNANYISQPAPRIVSALVTLAKALHPDAYAEANATATPSATPASTDTSPETATEVPGTEASPTAQPGQGSIPAPGPAAALAAVLGGTALAARRRRR